MKKFFAAVIALALIAAPGAVWANGEGPPNGPPGLNRNNVRIRNQNTNRNTNLNFNKNTNSNRNYNTNVNVNKLENKQHQSQQQYQGQSQGQIGINIQKDKNKQSVVVEGDTYEYPASTATGPALTSGNDTCMGSTSIGGQGMSFGFSLGTTWIDRNCIRLKNANALNRMGHKNAALALLAIDEDVAAALKATGVSFVALGEVIKEREAVTLAEANPGATFDKDNNYYGIDFEQID